MTKKEFLQLEEVQECLTVREFIDWCEYTSFLVFDEDEEEEGEDNEE